MCLSFLKHGRKSKTLRRGISKAEVSQKGVSQKLKSLESGISEEEVTQKGSLKIERGHCIAFFGQQSITQVFSCFYGMTYATGQRVVDVKYIHNVLQSNLSGTIPSAKTTLSGETIGPPVKISSYWWNLCKLTVSGKTTCMERPHSSIYNSFSLKFGSLSWLSASGCTGISQWLQTSVCTHSVRSRLRAVFVDVRVREWGEEGK